MSKPIYNSRNIELGFCRPENVFLPIYLHCLSPYMLFATMSVSWVRSIGSPYRNLHSGASSSPVHRKKPEGTPVELALWRDIALVWLAFLCFIGLIIPLAVSIFIVKGMHVAVDRTPGLLRQVQGYSHALRTQVDSASYRVAEPVIQVKQRTTRWSTVVNRIMRRPPASHP